MEIKSNTCFLVPTLLHSDVPFFPFLHQLSAVVPFSSDPVPLLSSTSLLSVQLFPSFLVFLVLSFLCLLFLLGGRALGCTPSFACFP